MTDAAAQRRTAIVDLLRQLWNEGRTAGAADAAANLERGDRDEQISVAPHDRLVEIAERVEDLAPTPAQTAPAPPASDLTRASDLGPQWRARVNDDITRMGVAIEAARMWPDGRADYLAAFEITPLGGPAWPMVRTVADDSYGRGPDSGYPAIVLPGDLGRALADALAEHYGGTTDARTTRRDFEHARGQFEQVVALLDKLAHRVADVADAAVANERKTITVLGATEVLNDDGTARPHDFTTSTRTGPIRPNPPRPDDVVDTRR